jgi:signal transduction histidine kinase/CheY-like chemotaxis protein
LQDIISLSAPQIDVDYHALVLASKDRESPYYDINQTRLTDIKEASPKIKRIYTLRQEENGQIVFVHDLNYNSERTTEIGEPLSNITPLLRSGLENITTPAIETELQENSAGEVVLYGYAPIADLFGRLEGILAIELDASSVVESEAQAKGIAIGTFLLTLVLAWIVVWLSTQRLIVRPILGLNTAAKQLANGHWEQTLSVERGDELGELAKSFNSMARQLRESFETLETRVRERTAELAESNEQLELAKEKAEAANQAKSAFLANMSHELRSPLNAILGFAQLMNRSSSLPPEHRENVGIITRSGEHLLTLINNVLDLSKIEAGRTTLNESNFDLYRLLDDLREMFRLKADEKKLQLLCDRSEKVPQFVRTDRVKLRQILINLLNNALKFTEVGGVSLRVELGESDPNQPTAAPNDSSSKLATPWQWLHFAIEDTGPGISPEDLKNLFQAFVQTETGKQAHEGTGLGLTISRKFVKLMGGDMTVSSEVGSGTTFEFDIKVQVVEGKEVESGSQPTRHAIALEPNQPRYRILVVDDKALNRQLLVKLLTPLGFEVREASNGNEAIAVWEDWEPDLIWMDMRMPVMDGYQATEYIKSTTKGQATAIIALTASVLEEERAVILSAGCDDFMRKPFREADIFAAMNKHIGVRYIYDDDASGDGATNASGEELTAEAIATLPVEAIVNLKQAILQGDLQLIDRLIEGIRAENAPLAQAIAECLDNFEYDRLLNLIPEPEEQSSASRL